MIRMMMTHRLLALLIVSCFMMTHIAYADSTANDKAKPEVKTSEVKTSNATTGNATKTKKTPEMYFSEGMACLKSNDLICAKTAQATIPSASSYAKALAGNIATAEQDFVSAFGLLLPLQTDKTLSPEAIASVHVSLAIAYDNQEDTLRALEQRVTAEPSIKNPLEVKANQARIWQALTSLPKTVLVEMRGNSDNTVAQGWIDLALAAASNKEAIVNWRNAYPDHPAADTIAQQFLDNRMFVSQSGRSSLSLSGAIALILPFSEQMLYPVADAIQQGFSAANALAANHVEIKTYATGGKPEEMANLYQQAITEGARFVVGPLTRDEVDALATTSISVPTLSLNQPEAPINADNLYSYGLTVDDEVTQIVKTARDAGMQSATIVMSNSALANRMAKAFSEAWTAAGGSIGLPIAITDKALIPTLKNQLDSNPTDMIFIAANAEEAREFRPFLNIATPTFGLSYLNDGLAETANDAPLNAIRFTDIPWMLDRNNEAFSAYVKAANDLPQGEMQRWFALGVDAYHILTVMTQRPNTFSTFDGLTGKISISATGDIKRELPMARFSKTGIIKDNTP